MGKVKNLLFLATFLIILLYTSQAENVYIKSYTVDKNETFIVPIYVSNVSNIVGVEVTLRFNPNVIQAVNVKVNDSYQCRFGCFSFPPNINNSRGFVRIAFIDTNGIRVNNSPIVDVIFKAVGNPGDSTEIVLTANMSDSNYNKITATTVNGVVTIASGTNVTLTQTQTSPTPTQTETTPTQTTTSTQASLTQTSTETTPVSTTTTVTQTSTATQTQLTPTPTQIETTPKPTPTATPQTIYTQTLVKTTEIVKPNTTQYITGTTPIPGFDLLVCLLSALIALIIKISRRE